MADPVVVVSLVNQDKTEIYLPHPTPVILDPHQDKETLVDPETHLPVTLPVVAVVAALVAVAETLMVVMMPEMVVLAWQFLGSHRRMVHQDHRQEGGSLVAVELVDKISLVDPAEQEAVVTEHPDQDHLAPLARQTLVVVLVVLVVIQVSMVVLES